jgi:hypothetical protein
MGHIRGVVRKKNGDPVTAGQRVELCYNGVVQYFWWTASDGTFDSANKYPGGLYGPRTYDVHINNQTACTACAASPGTVLVPGAGYVSPDPTFNRSCLRDGTPELFDSETEPVPMTHGELDVAIQTPHGEHLEGYGLDIEFVPRGGPGHARPANRLGARRDRVATGTYDVKVNGKPTTWHGGDVVVQPQKEKEIDLRLKD